MSAKPLADGIEIRDARIEEVDDLLPLMRAYCDFYEVDPPDEGLRTMARTLIEEPAQGSMFIARDLESGAAVGFASLDWKWSSTQGARVGYLEDLFVDPGARGGGIADGLIEACAERCRERGVPSLQWMTAPDNHRAQKVYDRVGGVPGTWIEYALEIRP